MWVDMCSVSLPCGAVWICDSVFTFLVVLCVDMCSVSLQLACGLICVLCLFLVVMWVDLCSVSLPCGDVG